MGAYAVVDWLLRWLGWRERQPGNAAPEAIETEANTRSERPVEAIRQAPAADDPMPQPTSEEPGGPQGGGGEDRRPSKPPKNRRERGRNARSGGASGGEGGGGEAVAVGGTSQPEERLQVSESRRNVPKSHQCKTCLRPDVEIINDKRRNGETLSAIEREFGIPMTSLIRHFRHSGVVVTADINMAQMPISENWRSASAEAPPEGADPLLWELGQLRKTAQGALAYATKTHNLVATASLLRAANDLLDLLSKIEKSKAEELKAQQAAATLPSPDTLEEIEQWLAGLRVRIAAAQSMQQPPTPAPKCPRCGQALPHGVQVEEEEPKPDDPGVH